VIFTHTEQKNILVAQVWRRKYECLYFLSNPHINKIRTFPIEYQIYTYPSEKGSDNKLTTLAA